MAAKIWIQDKLVDAEKAKISVFDHGLLYGDGVFEGIRVYGSRIFEFDAHIERLYKSAKVIRLDIPLGKAKLANAVEQTVKANNISDGYIRLIITRGVGDLGLDPFLCEKAQIIIIAGDIQLYPEELYEKGLKVISSATIRSHPLSIPSQVKSLNYLNSILAKIEAIDAGAGEAIMFNHEGYVAEASADNVFIVTGGELYTPPSYAGLLEGITRAIVMRLATQAGIKVIERNITRADLYTCDEFFLTGTGAEVIGVVEIDNRKIGDGKPGEMTKMLRKKFFEYARSATA